MCQRREVETATPDPAALAALDQFWPMFVNSRSLSVYLQESALGATQFAPGTFYKATTPYSYVKMKGTITPQTRDAHNRIGSWTNENGLIRLWAILESHGLMKPIRRGVRGSDEVLLLKRLRQHFAHGSGVYDSTKRDHRKLRRDLLTLFPVPGEHLGIPLNIDCVIRPMFQRCREYAEDVLSAPRADPPVEPADQADGQKR